MKNNIFGITSWMIADPRRAFLILSVIVVVLSLAFAAVPNGAALAEDIVGGS
jgi:hypothetical protein